MTVFDDGIALERSDDGSLRGRTIAQWANVVGPFGGITAATICGLATTHQLVYYRIGRGRTAKGPAGESGDSPARPGGER